MLVACRRKWPGSLGGGWPARRGLEGKIPFIPGLGEGPKACTSCLCYHPANPDTTCCVQEQTSGCLSHTAWTVTYAAVNRKVWRVRFRKSHDSGLTPLLGGDTLPRPVGRRVEFTA
jgi:hypothetical protein